MSMLNAALGMGRRLATQLLTEDVTVGSFTDGVAEDGSPTREAESTTYEGPARIKYESMAVSERDGAGSPVAAQTPSLSVPSGSSLIPEGEEVVVNSSKADASLSGRRYKVAGAPQAGQTTLHRYPLEELS